MKLAAEKLHTAEPVDEAAGQLAADKRRDKYVTLYKELVSELLDLINSDALWVILNINSCYYCKYSFKTGLNMRYFQSLL